MRKWIVGLVLLVAIVLVWLSGSNPLVVDTVSVESRELVVTVQEQGRTRARLPHIVTAPINGHMLRTTLVEGARVQQGDIIARLALVTEDTRTEATIRANLAAAQARYGAAQAALAEAESALPRARREAERRDRLFLDRMIGEEERDFYRQSVEAAEARLLSARAAATAASADVDNARAMLLGIDGALNDENTLLVVAPASGTVQRVYERGDRVIPAGTTLFQISDGDALELVIDLLTQDAVQVTPGDPILISGWGGTDTLHGVVDYIEPQAFTKFSALGVEEQRVNVIGVLANGNTGTALGAEYRIEAAIVTWQGDNVLTVATSALFRRDGAWQVFVVEEGEARLRVVETGRRSRDYAEVLDGLQAGDQVVAFPSDLVQDGVRVVSAN
jgi:HlyD family secretion protein